MSEDSQPMGKDLSEEPKLDFCTAGWVYPNGRIPPGPSIPIAISMTSLLHESQGPSACQATSEMRACIIGDVQSPPAMNKPSRCR